MRTMRYDADEYEYEDEYDPALYDTAAPTVQPTTGRWFALAALIVVLTVSVGTRGL